MAEHRAELTLDSEDATRRFAKQMGRLLRPGDSVLLSGDIGTGKTFLARALIQSMQDHPEDVPSPTFTLVQTYETHRGELWHSDLYRIGSTVEIEELGLTEAFETAICLVEWPDRLGELTPKDALELILMVPSEMATDQNKRRVLIRWTDKKWERITELLTNEAT